jgi:RHS repeat-associated protein
VETGTASCFAPLAADRLRRRPFASPTSPLKTRVQGFFRSASGRFSSRRRRSRAIATGCGACGYKTASGRGKWPNRDPIEEVGGVNLYRYARNSAVNERDATGLSSADCARARQALADALRNFDTAPGPLTQEALVQAVAEEAAACSGDNLPPLPPPTPLPVCKPPPSRNPFPEPPPYQNNQTFCDSHPVLCKVGIGVGIGVGVGVGIGIIISTGGAAAPILAPILAL